MAYWGAPQGRKVNSVEETSSLSDKIDIIMSMLVNGKAHIDPNNVPLASLVAQAEQVDVNFIRNKNFGNNTSMEVTIGLILLIMETVIMVDLECLVKRGF